MNILQNLPNDISSKIFIYFSHPVAEIYKLYYRSPQIHNLLEDIRNYHYTLKKIYFIPRDHNGNFGRATLLNKLWGAAYLLHGNYYKIWERMIRINSLITAKFWISNRYAIHPHKFQINSIWGLFTPKEREFTLNILIL